VSSFGQNGGFVFSRFERSNSFLCGCRQWTFKMMTSGLLWMPLRPYEVCAISSKAREKSFGWQNRGNSAGNAEFWRRERAS
jgi:hypothetical protein